MKEVLEKANDRMLFCIGWSQFSQLPKHKFICNQICKSRNNFPQCKLGVHIPVKFLTADKLVAAVYIVQDEKILDTVSKIGQQIRNENNLGNAINEIENYFVHEG